MRARRIVADQRRILATIAGSAQTAGTAAGTAFVRAAARETRPYLGDTWAFAMMDRMAHAAVPLIDAEPADRAVDRHTILRLTDMGARVLAGTADYVTLNGIDRWIGGVHLRGHDVPWRWNDATETITHR